MPSTPVNSTSPCDIEKQKNAIKQKENDLRNLAQKIAKEQENEVKKSNIQGKAKKLEKLAKKIAKEQDQELKR